MAKALKVIGTVAAAVALVATGVGAFAAAGTALASTAATVATYATLAAGVANVGASVLQKPPPARGSVSQMVVATDSPQPYVMGEGYFAGVLRYQHSYGATLNSVPNPYRFMVVTYSGAGPVDSIAPMVDQASVSSWYSGFLYTTTQLGACPESAALSPQWSGAPSWGAASKLSGKAAIGWSLKFDKDGKRFASGMPQLGAYGRWVKVYDPRLDSTFAGGSGSCRLGNEATYVWSENPALHAATYAYGRWQNGKRVIGIGLPSQAINWSIVAAWANTCDTNGWKLFGVVYEPGDRWANLRDICEAGGAQPVLMADGLSFHYQAPRVALDTITAADLVRGGSHSVTAMAAWRERINTIVPRFRSPDHNWELVQGDAISISSYVTADGETKQAEWPFNMVKTANQAAQLGRYRLENSRELQPIELECGARLAAYRPGDCLTLALSSELGLTGKAVIIKRSFDAARMAVKLTLIGETDAKHGYALGQTGAAPPIPSLVQNAQARDELRYVVAPVPADPNATNGATIGTNVRFTDSSIPTRAALETSLGTAAAIAGQGDLATANRASLPFGANALINSEMTVVDPLFSSTKPFGWDAGWGGNSTNSPSFNDRRVTLADGSFAFARDVTGTPNGTVIDCGIVNMTTYGFARVALPVLPGDCLAASALVAYQGATGVYITIGFYDENGAYVSEAGGATITANIGTGAWSSLTRANLGMAPITYTVPADGAGAGTGRRRWAVIWCRFMINGSTANPRFMMAAPMLTKVPANQTAIPAYIPGPPDRNATYGAALGTNLYSSGGALQTDASVITASGTAAAFSGQGPWATYSGMTPSQVANALSGGVETVAYGGVIRRVIPAGGTLALTGQVAVNAGGTTGTLRARIDWSPSGANSWSTVATGSGVTVSASEPGTDTVSGTFTNSTGVQQVFDFRIFDQRTPGTAGGTVITSQTFLYR